MQIIVRLAVLQGNENTAKWAFIKDSDGPRGPNYLTFAAFHSQPPVTLMQAKWKQEMDLIIPILQRGETKM